jgi:hypothetical protein
MLVHAILCFVSETEKVREWPWVSLNIRPDHLDDWTELAKAAGRSRAQLMREVLESVGLPYARALVKERKAA